MCNWLQQSKKYLAYENIKKLALAYSKSENKEVYIYRLGENFGFSEVENKEEIERAVEFIQPL